MNPKPVSRLSTFRHVFFDCDSTLTAIEGIDELARMKGQFEYISDLTRRAMDGEIDLEAVFSERLLRLRPTRADIRQIARAYCEQAVPNARAVIDALKAGGCEVAIISGGLLEAVQKFARWLGVFARNVRAVPVEFDQLSGEWWRYDQDRYGGNPDEHYLDIAPTPLIETEGKRAVIKDLAAGQTRTMLVGDGITDLEARGAVKLFVGFGGAVRRRRVAEEADVFIDAPGLEAVVPLALGENLIRALKGTEHERVLQQGIDSIQQGLVRFRNRTLERQIEFRIQAYTRIDDPTIDLLQRSGFGP